jgi:hypothetical protein
MVQCLFVNRLRLSAPVRRVILQEDLMIIVAAGDVAINAVSDGQVERAVAPAEGGAKSDAIDA